MSALDLPILEERAADRWVERRAASGAEASQGAPAAAVRRLLERVRREGDAALLELTEALDGVRPPELRVPRDHLRTALETLAPERRAALERSRRNVERFHAAQRPAERRVEVEPGITAWREFRPIRRVGLYVPGGRAAYPSSLLMTAVPARLAGCAEIAVCSPPGPDGRPAPAVLATAALLGLDEVYAVGGAQAVGALAYGTESVARVHKVFGPGGAWVHAAKLAAFEAVAVDLPAGPSEVVVWVEGPWVEGGASAARVAAELVAQAEHGPDSLCAAILTSRAAARDVRAEAARRLDELAASAPERAEAARASLEASALLVSAASDRAAAWVEELAPEHLALHGARPRERARRVGSAGTVFLGEASPVAAGDYAAGPNHVLPTGGRARGAGGLGLADFGRMVQFLEMSPSGLASLAPAVRTLAAWEGLPAHAASVEPSGASLPERSAAGPVLDGTAEGGVPEQAAQGPGTGAADPWRLLRPHLAEARPYLTARAQHGTGLLMDANENAWGTLTPEVDAELHRYPHPAAPRLRGALAARLGVSPEAVWLTNGSDEGLDLLVRCAAAPGETVAVASPSYGVYAARVASHDARLLEVPLDERFDLDVDAFLARAGGARLALLCSPNNPTGNALTPERVLELARRFAGLVAVDEAYVEFAATASLVGRAAEAGNLVVVRTFSKAWGMAGARVGYGVARPALAEALRRAGLPYPVSRPSLRAAELALGRAEEMAARVARIRSERGRLAAALEAMGLRPLRSEANFLLFFVPDAREVQRRLAEAHGIIVRHRGALPRLEGSLRVTVGTPADNDAFLAGLREVLRR